MATIWSWSSSADTAPELFVGAAPTIDTTGSYGERYLWPATTAVAFARKTVAATNDFGFRFIYTVPTPATSASMVCLFADSSSAIVGRVDVSAAGLLRIRDASTQVAQGTVALAQAEHRFEVYRVASSGLLTVKAYRVSDNSLRDTISATVGTAAVTQVYMGNNAPVTGTLGSFAFDEMVFTNVAAEVGPLASVLSATATVSPASAAAPYTLTLTISASGGSGSYQYQVTNWGDGTTSPAQSSNVFTKAIASGVTTGTKTVSWLVTG